MIYFSQNRFDANIKAFSDLLIVVGAGYAYANQL
jgi:hypothetical protein